MSGASDVSVGKVAKVVAWMVALSTLGFMVARPFLLPFPQDHFSDLAGIAVQLVVLFGLTGVGLVVRSGMSLYQGCFVTVTER